MLALGCCDKMHDKEKSNQRKGFNFPVLWVFAHSCMTTSILDTEWREAAYLRAGDREGQGKRGKRVGQKYTNPFQKGASRDCLPATSLYFPGPIHLLIYSSTDVVPALPPGHSQQKP